MTRANPLPTRGERSIAAILVASSAGTILEWYDFIIYGTAAALVFAKVFFPQFDPVAGTLASLGVFSVGFLMRPLGGVLFGSLGDRFGRRPVLLGTIALMGVTTTLIGLLPTYAAIGVWAPALLVLLRMIQGLGAGAEFGGAILMAAEASPARRGLHASIPSAAVDVATLAATGTFALFTALPADDFLAWGWRVPFLLGFPLLVLGIWFRRRVPESPEFQQVAAARREGWPIAELLRDHPRRLLTGMAVNLSPILSYVYQVFTLTYVTTVLQLPRQVALTGVLLAVGASIPICIGVGVLADRFGARLLIALGAAMTATFAFPFFWMLDTRTPLMIWLAVFLGQAVANRMMFAAQPAYYTALFPTHLRYSGIACSREVTAALVGGPLPLVAAGLVAWGGGPWPVAAIMCGLSVITLGAVLASPPPLVAQPAPPLPRGDALAAG